MASFMVMRYEHERILKRERVFRDRTRQLDTLTDGELFARYRMPRHSLVQLVHILSPHLNVPTERSHALSPESKVLITLRFLSKGGFFTEIGDLHGIVKSSVSRVFNTTIQAICNELPQITFPSTAQALRCNMQAFYNLAGFPMVIGAIDGTLISIKRPPSDEEAAYVSRKGYHAINVQAICDADLRLINVVAKWPGATHDSTILSNSAVGENFAVNKPDGFLLGDSGYGCRPWLMTPIAEPSNRAEERYNTSHCKTRNTVERAFGVLKSRFRCLHKSTGCLPFSPKKSCKVIMACCKLHNYCLEQKIPLPIILPDATDDTPVPEGQTDGFQARLDLIQRFFT